MFGRMRASSSSPDSLERPPSKILKDDSLSIYEATLVKLKLGSQHDLVERETNCASASVPQCSRDSPSSPCVETMKIEPNCTSTSVSPNEEVMMIDVDNLSVWNSASSSDSQSTGVSKQQQSRNMSVLYLFSKYKSSKHALSSSHEEVVMIENDGFSVSVSPSSSDCQSFSGTNEQSEEEFASSLPVCQMLDGINT